MRRLILCLVAICAVVLPAAAASPANSATRVLCVLHTNMSAANETTGSTSKAVGPATIKVRTDGISFKVIINNKAQDEFTMGHIHVGAVGVAGPVVVPLFVPPAPSTSDRHIKQSGLAQPNAGTTGAGICAAPANYYVNYHTTAFPGGAIRGQLHS